MNRRQDRQQILSIDPATGAANIEFESHDECWVEWIDGLPMWNAAGELVVHLDDLSTNTRRVAVVREGAAQPFTPVRLQIGAILGSTADGVMVAATPDSPFMQAHSVTWEGAATALAGTDDDGWHSCIASSDGSLLVVASSSLRNTTTTWRLVRNGADIGTLTNLAVGPELASPPVNPSAELIHLGELSLRTIVIFPTGHVRGSRRLPLIMSPYGGPHAVSALAHLRSHARAQYLADQGFTVAITDNRGTPWRGPVWEREVFRDLSTKVLADQVAAVEALGQMYPDDIDTSRVGIRGWSFGGYLSALAVLDAPDTFHAAVAGAPVTEWRLYDTGYTERYMGDPESDKSAYDACSLLPKAPQLVRPLLLVHGMADDNVVAAHSLQLSGALLAAGRDHEFLPLTGVTHMTPQETISENLLVREVDFFARHLQS
jgi:dipeptidyl-peptidase-4